MVGLVLKQDLPNLVATVRPRDLTHDASMHDHLADGRARHQRLVRCLLHRHDVATPVKTIGADQDLRLAVPQTGRDRLRPVA